MIGTIAIICAVLLSSVTFPIETTQSAHKTPDGTVVITAVRDVTERLQMEEQLRHAHRIDALARELRERLSGAGYEVLDGREARSGLVTFRSTTESPEVTQSRLSANKINTNVALTQSARLDMDPRGIPAAVRASVHYFNTSDEITALIDALHANR